MNSLNHRKFYDFSHKMLDKHFPDLQDKIGYSKYCELLVMFEAIIDTIYPDNEEEVHYIKPQR